MAESLGVDDDPVSRKNAKDSKNESRTSLRLGDMSSDTLPPGTSSLTHLHQCTLTHTPLSSTRFSSRSSCFPLELDAIEEEFHRVKLRSVSSMDEAMLEEVVQEVLKETHSAVELVESKDMVLSADEDIVEG